MPMTRNERLYSFACQAIREMFNDRSVSQEECAQNLENLKEEIDTLIDTLDLK